MNSTRIAIVLLTLMTALLSCAAPQAGTAVATPQSPTSTSLPVATPPTERTVTPIPLAGPVAERAAEVSGLAWYGEYLILLPQYPDFFTADGDGYLFALNKADIMAFLAGEAQGPLEPRRIAFVAPGLRASIPGFEGYEALAFDGETAYLTIEARERDGMHTHLVQGTLSRDLSTLEVAPLGSAFPRIPAPADLSNQADEALLVTESGLLTIYEANGASVNPQPRAHRFTRALAPNGTLDFPPIEYRVTDVTAVDGDGRFWAINYFFPGDDSLRAANDPLADAFGRGPTHAQNNHVERLVELQLAPNGIRLSGTPPIQLALESEPRNWEGIVRLDERGFLLVTDRFPETILAFVAR